MATCREVLRSPRKIVKDVVVEMPKGIWKALPTKFPSAMGVGDVSPQVKVPSPSKQPPLFKHAVGEWKSASSGSVAWRVTPPTRKFIRIPHMSPYCLSAEHTWSAGQRLHGSTMTFRLLRFPSNCSHSWIPRTFVVTFCMRASQADVYPELLQDTREPGDHTWDGAPHSGCCLQLRDMALQVRVAPCLLHEPAQGVLDRTVRSGPGSPVLAAKQVERRHRCLSAEHTSSVVQHRA